ncbi:hypothetical protein [Rhodopirellula halodulae]|uniref:hypothetical protein n=1 Tax=Rhodopirellula halodulae TaxID=2894198 RepID=UPI001E463C48|nr:hypothetical protein [Rhodopirellula sp. JC740]
MNDGGLKKFRGETPAATQWSRGLLKGLAENGCDVKVFAPIWDALFPKGALFPGNGEFLDQGFDQQLVRYLNFPGVRTRSVADSLKRVLRNEVAKNEPAIVLNYNPYPHYCQAMKSVLKDRPQVKWFNVVLDLDDPTLDKWSSFAKATNGASGAVFLSWWGYENAPVEKKLHLDAGVFSPKVISQPSKLVSKKIYVYAGKLADYGGLPQVISAIKRYDDPLASFKFFGKGTSKALADLASHDSRVEVFGFVSDDELKDACGDADAFLSPRDVDFQGTRMIFPSKILYYLQFGKPVLGPMLPGLAPEYKDVLLDVGDGTPDLWGDAFNSVKCMTSHQLNELECKIERILDKRTWCSQGRRLLDFVCSE